MKNGKIEIELKCNNYIPHENWLVFFSVFKEETQIGHFSEINFL